MTKFLGTTTLKVVDWNWHQVDVIRQDQGVLQEDVVRQSYDVTGFYDVINSQANARIVHSLIRVRDDVKLFSKSSCSSCYHKFNFNNELLEDLMREKWFLKFYLRSEQSD